jgi:hypothetical protein
MGNVMSRVLAFLKKEFLELLPPTIFFFVAFHVVVFTRSLSGKDLGISMASSAAATIAALIVGKSILIADALPLFEWFRDKRLIYNVAWRVFLYLCVVLLFQMLEELIPLVTKYGGLASASGHLIDEIHWPKFWATHIVLDVFLVVYSVVTAMIGVIGGDRCLEIFLGWRKTPAE